MTRYAYGPSAFEIDSLPSQCQVAICHGFFVKPESRGQGLAHLAKMEQARLLKDLAYDYAICTVMASNQAQKRVLEKAGWAHLTEFYSARQDEQIEIWGKATHHEGDEPK